MFEPGAQSSVTHLNCRVWKGSEVKKALAALQGAASLKGKMLDLHLGRNKPELSESWAYKMQFQASLVSRSRN